MLRSWLDRAVPALDAARERIDAVNVFPVPDGDTGTNVLLTVRGAADAVRALDPAAPGPDVLRALGRGALLAARGNSGVILSRYLGGLAEVPGAPLPEALRRAAEVARTAVHQPEDGTVLTVAARVAAAAQDAAGRSGADEAAVLAAGVAAGRSDLAGISAAHPVLRSARVVDAGACALLVLLDALAAALAGATGPVDVSWLAAHAGAAVQDRDADRGAQDGTSGPDDRAYEVMAVLHGADPAGTDGLRAALATAGDAVAVVEGAGVLTAHVHADDAVGALAAVDGCGGRWTATVRALVPGAGPGGPGAVVACTAHPVLAGTLALAGVVALVLPAGVPEPEVRAALARAVEDARGPVHAPPPGTVPPGAEVVVLPGDRPAAAAASAGAPEPVRVRTTAVDELQVLAAAVALAHGGRGDGGAPTAVAADLDAALAAVDRLLAAGSGGPDGSRALVVLLGAGTTADDGLDLADRLAVGHPDVPVVVAGPVPAGPAYGLAIASSASTGADVPGGPAHPSDPSHQSDQSEPRAEARP